MALAEAFEKNPELEVRCHDTRQLLVVLQGYWWKLVNSEFMHALSGRMYVLEDLGAFNSIRAVVCFHKLVILALNPNCYKCSEVHVLNVHSRYFSLRYSPLSPFSQYMYCFHFYAVLRSTTRNEYCIIIMLCSFSLWFCCFGLFRTSTCQTIPSHLREV